MHTPDKPQATRNLQSAIRDPYDPRAVEAKWQARWEELGVNRLDLYQAARPYYNLMMFPYPSGEGLHVGNVFAFTGADIHGRFRRLQGHDVFEPIGFDAFGIHSENYALKVDLHPMDLIPRNVRNFRRQLRRIGGMFNWEKELDTTSPDYYRWTQWIFTKLFDAGLAVRKEAAVNWCPRCKTVVANEQVIDGRCERHPDTAVGQRVLPQWFFRITAYAQRLLDNLDWIDWSETTKTAQRNWIGRSEGAEIDFPMAGPPGAAPSAARQGEGAIRVYTTRPDTVFGATYMVLAPEHPLVAALTTAEHRGEVELYRERAAGMDLVLRRSIEGRQKTGVFTGSHALNPATGERIPVWIADYVLMDVGTGAIMAVPAHDQRDFEFARQFGLPVRRVILRPDEIPTAELAEAYTGEGTMIESGLFSGTPSREGVRAVTAWLEQRGQGKLAVHYRLRDWCISRQRYWGPPIPIVYCDSCGVRAVPERDLPVVLPRIADFRPDESGVSPLARHREWFLTPCPSCGVEARRETDVSDTFLDSAWYYFRYPSAGNDREAWEPELTARWLPVDRYTGGNEHAVLHLLYTRFLSLVFHDLGLYQAEEPFKQFRAHGLIIKDGAKMSKSRGNVVIPDQYIDTFGADAFRTYLMFLGPYQAGGDFRDEGIAGIRRFFERLWDSVVPADSLEDGGAPVAARSANATGPVDREVEHKLHATIRKVTDDLESLSYNTAIAAMMEYLNVIRAVGRRVRRAEIEPLVLLVSPFAPHLAEELWEQLGHFRSLFVEAHWPAFDPAKARGDLVEIVVQVDGKVRARLSMERGAQEEQVREQALAQPNVQRHLDAGTPVRSVFVPDRLLNLIRSG